MKSLLPSCLALVAIHAPLNGHAAPLTTTSPDGKLAVTAGMDAAGAFTYMFQAHDRKLIAPSGLGLDFGPAGRIPGPGWKSGEAVTRSVDSTWKPVWGKRATVPDRYREVVWELVGPAAPFDRMSITLRVYDDGIAFRYGLPTAAKGGPVKAIADQTENNFAGDFPARLSLPRGR